MAIISYDRSTWRGALSKLAEHAYPAERWRGRWGTLFLFGCLQLAMGAVSMIVPELTSFTAALFFGTTLLVLGVLQFAGALADRHVTGDWLRILSGLLYMCVGLLMALFPLLGALTLVALVAVAFIVEGALLAGSAVWLKPPPNWKLQMWGGLAGSAIGVMLLSGWPLAGVSALGVMLGINLLFSGLVHCALALGVRATDRRARG